MFDLQSHGTFHWNILFLLLSMDKADSYWAYIDFPILPKPIRLEKVARNFVLQFDPIATQVHTPLESNHLVINLFTDTYQSLVAELGTEKAEQFCNWGNQLNRLERIRHSAGIIWESIFGRMVQNKTNHLFIKSLFSSQNLGLMQQIVTNHITDM